MRKNKLSLVTLIISLALFLPRTEASQELPFDNPGNLISLDLKDANLKDVLKIFSVQSGLNFVATDSVQDRNITLYLDNVPIKEAMDKIFKVNNLSYELDRDSDIFIIKDWGKPKIETVTRVFRLKHSSLPSSALVKEKGTAGAAGSTSGIVTALTKLLTENGSLVEDPRTNSLVITDIPSRIPVIAKAIESLDIQVPQVLLEVEMLDVSKNMVDKMGINWASAASYSMKIVSASRGSLWPLTNMFSPDSAKRPNFSANDAAGTVSFPTSLQWVIDFLKTQTDTKYLARPRILTLNNETAEIKITTQEAVGVNETVVTGSSSTTATAPERVETGVILRVTPQVNPETGEITMFISPTVKDTSTSTFNNGTAGGSQVYKDPEERSIKSTVRIQDGDSVILAGLIRNNKTEVENKIPFLGDIPLLGLAFRHKNKSQDKERELLVFITPHIVKDGAAEKQVAAVQVNKATLPLREQNIASLNNRSSAMSTSLDSVEKRE